MIKPNAPAMPFLKIMVNTGGLYDIPTGSYLIGDRDQAILDGGLAPIEACTGGGNTFKSNVATSRQVIAMDQLNQGLKYGGSDLQTFLNLYDADGNGNPSGFHRFTDRYPTFGQQDPVASGLVTITDKSGQWGDEFFKSMTQYHDEKVKMGKRLVVPTPFLDQDKKQISIPVINLWGVDSISYFETKGARKVADEDLGDKDRNTVNWAYGRDKAAFWSELPRECNRAYSYCYVTSHIGKNSDTASGPSHLPPPKQLSGMLPTDKIIGASRHITTVPHNLWWNRQSKSATNQATKGAEYPEHPELNNEPNLDQVYVDVKLIRGKFGPSDFINTLVVSQSSGINPEATYLNLIRDKEYFGTSGGTTNFNLDVLPGLKITRVNAMAKCKEHPELIRALKITADLYQLKRHRRHIELWKSPKDLYDAIVSKGYSWDKLYNTRDYWTFFDDKHPIPYLSTLDLLRMAASKDLYKPDWY